MNYKISIKCDIKNVDEGLKNRLEDIKEEIAELNLLYLKQNEKVAYYYKDMNTETVLSCNSDILFYAASSIKILVCVMLLEMAEKGSIDLEEKILVKMEDLKQDTGIIKFQKKDTYYSIKELIKLTLVESDNTAYIKLVNYVGKDNLEIYGKSLGADHTMEGKDLFGLINCDDMIKYWEKTRNYIIGNYKFSKDFHDWLSNPSFSIIEKKSINSKNFVKKYGSWDIAYHEAGYIEDNNPFYLIVLTQKLKCCDKKDFVNETAKRICKIHELINSNL